MRRLALIVTVPAVLAWTLAEDAGQRVSRWLVRRFPGVGFLRRLNLWTHRHG